jgi:hypothetical protein
LNTFIQEGKPKANGQNQNPDNNRFKITAGELIKHFPDKGHGGASRKLFFKDTTFTLDYMNFYSISYDSSLVAILRDNSSKGNM